MDKQSRISDDEIKEYFKQEKFTNQLHVVKIYLYELILKGLRNYHATGSVYSTIINHLCDIAILYEKELYHNCAAKLEKAEKLVVDYEMNNLQPEIFSWKRKLHLARPVSNSALDKIIESESDCIQRLVEINHLWDQTNKIYTNYKDKRILRSLSHKRPGSLRALTLSRHIAYSCHYINGNTGPAEEVISDLIQSLEARPEIIHEDPSSYVTAISNKIGLLIPQKRWQDIGTLILQMRKVPEKYKLKKESKFALKLWLRIYNLELELCRDAKLYAKITELIFEIQEFISSRERSLPSDYKLMIYYQISSICFSKQEYSKALEWNYKIMNTNFGDVRVDLQCYSRILNLAIHFELNNIILLRYAADSARRFLRKKKFNGVFPQSCLKLFSQLSLVNPVEYKSTFKRMYAELFSMNSADHSFDLDYFDLKGWLKNKLNIAS